MSAAGELLSAAKELLGKGKSLGASARTEDGTPCDPYDKDAAKFSVYGALMRAAYDRRDSTGIDAAMLYLGSNNIQDPRMDGMTAALDDEEIAKRFDEAIERADGGPVKARSLDAEKKMLDPNAPDYIEKLRELPTTNEASLGTTGAEETAQAKRMTPPQEPSQE